VAAGGMPMRRQCVRIVFAEMPLVPHGSSLRFRTVAARRELPSHKAVRDQALGVQGLGKCVVDCAPQRSLNVSPSLLKIRSGYLIDRASTEHRIGQRGSAPGLILRALVMLERSRRRTAFVLRGPDWPMVGQCCHR